MLEPLILGMVLDNELTGYDIKKYIEKNFGVFYKASFGSLYPALKRLTARGFLTAVDKPIGNRQKTFYSITESGKTSFFEWLSTPAETLDGTNNMLIKVFFFDRLADDEREIQLSAYELKNVVYLNKLETLEKKFSQMPNQECFYYKLSTLYYGISVTKKNIEWCNHIRNRKPLKNYIEKGE